MSRCSIKWLKPWILLLLSTLTKVHGACNEPLGLESGQIKNSQITSSDSYYGRYQPETARLNNRYGWLTISRTNYVQIDFLASKTVSAIAVQGVGSRLTKMLWLFYSLDGRVWDTYRDRTGSQNVRVSATSSRDIVKITLDSSLQARYIAISPRSSRPALRLEVYGCNTTVEERIPTLIDRDIESNAVWTASGSPYIIKSYVTIRPSSQVSIQPGVKVIFEGQHSGVLIRGSLIASGIQGLPVCFWSNEVPNEPKTSWRGFAVESSGRFYCNFCDLRHADVGVSGSVESLSLNATKLYQNSDCIHLTNAGTGTRTFHNLQLTENRDRGILVSEGWLSRSRILVRDSIFEGNEYAMLLKSSCDFEVVACNITYNKHTGIRFDADVALTVRNSRFKGNENYGIRQYSQGNMAIYSSHFENSRTGLSLEKGGATLVQGTTFKNNRYSGIEVNSKLKGDLNISASHFESNAEGVGIDVESWGAGHIRVTNSTFQDNTDYGIDVIAANINITLENNTFNGSDSLPLPYPFAVALDNNWGYYPAYVVLKDNLVKRFAKQSRVAVRRGRMSEKVGVQVLDNLFEDLSGTYALNIHAEMVEIANNTFINGSHTATLNVTGINTIIHHNVFENPKSKYDITSEVLYKENTSFDARFNFFGSTNKKYLRSRVNDVYQNLSRAEIKIDPFYTSSSLEALDSGTDDYSDKNPADVGGKLQGDVLISGNKRLVVKRSLVIPEGRTLTIEPDVTLTFEKEQGIIVKGVLKLQGSNPGTIVLKNGMEQKWGGIIMKNSELELSNVRLEAAKTFSNLPSSRCPLNFSILIDQSVVEVDSLDLNSRLFNLTITDSQLKSPNQTFRFSDCGRNQESEDSGFFVMERAKIVSRKFNVNSGYANSHEIRISESEFEELKNSGKNITIALHLGQQSQTSLAGNTFNNGKLEISSDESPATNISITSNVFNAFQLDLRTPNVNMTHNIFENTPLYALRFTGETFKDDIINGSLNYWGTERFLEVRARVYDKTKDQNLPRIDVVPFFRNRALTQLVEHVSFVGENNTVGGNVDGSVSLTRSHSPYTVISTIYVGKEHSLAIDADVQLLFKENTGIVVEGSFFVSGKVDMPVSFRSEVPGIAWDGVTLKGHEGDVRFFGGKDEREGIVEIRTGTAYGTVCEKGFDELDARVICRMAGFDPEGGVVIYKGNEAENLFGERSNLGDIIFNNVRCAGNESNLYDCKRDPNIDRVTEEERYVDQCYHNDDVGIRCLGDSLRVSHPEIRLEYLELNDTSTGLTLGGNITKASHIKSRFSRTNGITFNTGYFSGLKHEFDNIEASFNTKHGIAADGMDRFRNININNCKLSNNEVNGIGITGQSVINLKNCEISHNEAGISSKDYMFINISISESNITSNKKHAVLLNSDGYEEHELYLNILNSNISHHDTSDKYYEWSSTVYYHTIVSIDGRYLVAGNIHFEGNTFQNNSGDLFIYNYNSIDKQVSTVIKSNEFVNNTGKIIDISDGRRGKHLIDVTANTFSRNRGSSSGDTMLRVYLSDEASKLRIFDNTLIDNQASRLVNIDTSKTLDSNINFSNNSMIKNRVEHVLWVDLYMINIHFNTFANPSAVCELRMPNFVAGKEINATMNFWGFTNVSQIMFRICGFDYDMNHGFVTYLPSLLSNTSSDVTPERQTDFFLLEAIGGVVDGDLTLNNTDSSFNDTDAAYVIERSIMIRDGGRLILHGGTRLLFKKNRGIYSFGECSFAGVFLPETYESLGSKQFHNKQSHRRNTPPSGNSGMDDHSRPFQSWNGGNVDTVSSSEEIVLTRETGETWYGLVFNQRSDLSLSHLNVSGSRHGVILDTKNVVLSNCDIHSMENSGVTLTSRVSTIDMTDSVIHANKEHGVLVKANSVVIHNGAVYDNAESGLYFKGSTNYTQVYNLHSHNNEYGIVFYQNDRESMGVLTANCSVHNNKEKGLYISSRIYSDGIKNVSVINCTFSNNPTGLVDVKTDHARDNDKRFIDLKANTFSGDGFVNVLTAGWSNVTIRKNSFINMSSPNCLVNVEFENAVYRSPRQMLHVLHNKMNNSSSKCGFALQSSLSPEGGFLYNDLSHSDFTDGSVLVGLANYSVSENILDNPDSDFELKVVKGGPGFVNATKNWWGMKNLEVISERILDKADDATLLNVIYQPALLDRKFDCSLVKNCTGHGECVRPNDCECYSGWKGSSCDMFDCSKQSECNGGTCVGPNVCECSPGWIGASCTTATCYGVNNCSERGFCTEPDTCTCLSQFIGDACEGCAPNRWGLFCVACPRCVHGSCHKDTGLCVCESANWNGTLCDRCSRSFYGVHCLPITTVLTVSPDAGADVGGTLVHVKGDNFNVSQTNTYKCKFGPVIVDATRHSRHYFTCVSPRLSPRTVALEISSDGKEFTNNKVQFTFVPDCQLESCGNAEEPPRGQCIFGQCACNLPWTGRTCSVEIISPVIGTVSDKDIIEGQVYRERLALQQGTSVILWSIITSPEGMVIDKDTGELIWNTTVGSTTPYTVSVRAENAAGHNDIEWSITVPLSYSVVVDDLTPSGVVPYPTEIQITGHLNITAKDLNLISPSVKLLIRNNGITRELTASTNKTLPPGFAVTFIPRADDTGVFSISANHPSDDQFLEQASWRIQTMVCEPREVYLTEYLVTDSVTFRDVANLTNAGLDPIENIYAQVESYIYIIDEATLSFGSSNDSSLSLLPTNGSETFDLTITHDGPIKTELYVLFRSELGTRAVLKVNLNLKVKQPILSLSPHSIKRSVVKGKQTIFNVNVTNTGEALAEGLDVDVSNVKDLEVASISSSSVPSSEKVDLAEGDSATIVFVYTTPSDIPLGVASGSLVIKAGVAETLLKFSLHVTSIDRYDIQVFVEDEYSYFAADKPLLAGAKVTMKNPRRGIKESLVTNETGSVLFKDVYGDQYTLQVDAANHTSTSNVIVVDGTRTTFSVFLQRTAVTYTWSVTKTTFEDEYRIHLESTFETRVPMPVVTVEPALLDLFPYTEGRKTKLEFLLTNHGYIRADNVRFVLPDHPSLRFIQLVDPVGDLEANTSTVVPFKVEQKTVVKRSAGGKCAGLLVLYDYKCFKTRTKSASVTVTNTPPDSPPKPCGVGSYHVRGRRTVGSGGTFGYIAAITDLSCDCQKAYLNDCLIPLLRLPYELVPGVGCLLDIYDMSQFDESTSAIAIATTMENYLLDCGFGLSCPVCPIFFKFLVCLDGLLYACTKASRTKRDVNSLIPEIVKAKDHLNNYLDLSRELMGNLSVVDVKGDWKTAFLEGIAEKSPMEYLLNENETDTVLQLVDTDDEPLILAYLERWNNTFAAWRDGKSLPSDTNAISLPRFKNFSDIFLADSRYTKERGFTSIFQHFDYTVTEYKKSLKDQKEEGVCAKVRIRLDQDLVLTRDAFLARLEIDNGETAPLEDIKVDIFITRTDGNGSTDNHLFSIGEPQLEGISDVSGTGNIETGVEGSVEWLIVAYNGAAVGGDVDYDVGGNLSYTLAGREFNVPLLPSTITVSPNPSLTLAYFHEKYVQGNDPLTDKVEKSVPFSLSVMVTNDGEGVARQIRITSGQPEIVDNEKGLLIAFKIISAQLGNDPIQPSLTVDFGDVSSHETKTARWFMTSSLKGKFYNYSATFENINPLGDPQLSVFDSISYHDMIHLVRIDESGADGLDDFLVNDIADKNDLPDRLYDSSDGSKVYQVEAVQTEAFTETKKATKGSRRYTFVQVVVPPGSKDWRYSRVVNNVTRDAESESLLQVTRDDGKEILIPQNSWLTSHYDDKFYFHLFDKDTRQQSVYTAVFGSKNLYQPSFEKESYYIETGVKRTSQDIIAFKATDKGGDEVSYKIDERETIFSVNRFSGMLRNEVPLAVNGTFEFTVYAIDNGVPPKSASASVTVVITSTTTDDLTTKVATDPPGTTEISGSDGRSKPIPFLLCVSSVIYLALRRW